MPLRKGAALMTAMPFQQHDTGKWLLASGFLRVHCLFECKAALQQRA